MKPIVSEKAVRLIESNNSLVIEVPRRMNKEEIKKEFEEIFKGAVEKININIRKNKKYAYIKLKQKTPAIDIATKFGLI